MPGSWLGASDTWMRPNPQNSAGRPVQDTEGPGQGQSGDHWASAGFQAGLEAKDELIRVNNAAAGLPISWLQSRDSEKGGDGWGKVPTLSASKTGGLTEQEPAHRGWSPAVPITCGRPFPLRTSISSG